MTINSEAYNTMKSRGSALDAGVMLERWMNAEPDITDVKYDVKWIPIGPWDRGGFSTLEFHGINNHGS